MEKNNQESKIVKCYNFLKILTKIKKHVGYIQICIKKIELLEIALKIIL